MTNAERTYRNEVAEIIQRKDYNAFSRLLQATETEAGENISECDFFDTLYDNMPLLAESLKALGMNVPEFKEIYYLSIFEELYQANKDKGETTVCEAFMSAVAKTLFDVGLDAEKVSEELCQFIAGNLGEKFFARVLTRYIFDEDDDFDDEDFEYSVYNKLRREKLCT